MDLCDLKSVAGIVARTSLGPHSGNWKTRNEFRQLCVVGRIGHSLHSPIEQEERPKIPA